MNTCFVLFSCRFVKFLGILTLESFTAAALGLSVGAAAPNTDAAVAIGPAVMLVWIIFGGFYCNAENIPRYCDDYFKHTFGCCVELTNGLSVHCQADNHLY